MEPLISSRIVNDEGPLLQNGMPAELDVTRGFANIDSLTGEEPLSFAIQQTYQGHGHLKNFSGQPRQALKTLIVTGIKKAGNIQGL